MPTPQQPELRRSGHNAVDEGAPETTLPAQGDPGAGGAGTGPVPEDNLPGHHPEVEQDKPAAADFVAKAKEVAARGADDDEAAGGRPAKRTTKAAKAAKATKKAAPRGRKAAEAPPTQTGAPTAEPEGAASPPAPTPIVSGTPQKRTPAASARAPRASAARSAAEPTQTSAPRADRSDGPTSPTAAQTRPTQATTTRPSAAPVASAPAGGAGPATEADAPTATPDAVAAEATTGRTAGRPRPLIEVPRVDRGGDALRLVLLPLRVATFPARATLHVVTWLWRRR